MKELQKKNELAFSLIWIAVYVMIMSVCETLADSIGIQGAVTAPVSILLIAVMCFIIHKKKKLNYYGFTPFSDILYAKVLFLLPFIVIATANLWRGAVLRFSPLETVLYVIAMFDVGFLEEVIFRGFLLRAIMRRSVRRAVIISSVTFGLGHIVNLANGAEFLPTILQLIYAVAIGFMLSVFVIRVNNIIPCILFHGVFNALAAFSNEAGQTKEYQILVCLVVTILAAGYALYLWKQVPEKRVLS